MISKSMDFTKARLLLKDLLGLWVVRLAGGGLCYILDTEGPALRVFWDLEKPALHEIRDSGTVPWSPINANSPTCTYISLKPW